MTYKQISDRVIVILGLQDDTTAPEVGLVQEWILEGITDIAARTRAGTRVINLKLSADTPVHDMSNEIISLLDLEDSTGFMPHLTREDAVSAQARFERGFAYEEPLLWFSPVPTKDMFFKAYGVFRPRPMENDDDTPANASYGNLADEFHPTIVTYCLWKGGEYVEHEQSGGGERWRVQYEGQDGKGGEISKIKAILSKRVTPQAARRRNPVGQIGSLSRTIEYLGG
jgi:hypothetical protein